jgi:hypothetical protein
MIVTDKFVFLHLHKSGGTFVNDCLMRFIPGARQIGYHLPRSQIPPMWTSLPALGLVRNPWSYYVSWFAFQSRRQQPNVLFRILSEEGRLGFGATVRNMLQLGSTGNKLDRLIAELPAAYTNRGLNLPGSALEALRGSNLGFYSYLYRYMYDMPGIMHIGRMEMMRTELPSMLLSVGQTISEPLREYIAQAPPSNTSEHVGYIAHYDDALRDLVAQRDASIIARHLYRFGA